MGFCFFNNVAVAAAHARAAHGVERVLILDWDVHHGNGTNDIFHADPTVLFCSIHEWPLYPGDRRRRRTPGRATARASRSTCRCPAGRATTCTASLVEHVVAPLIRAGSRSSCSCRRASTRTAPTRSRRAS